MAKIQSEATSASAKLSSLKSNTTLVDACASMSAAKDAKKGM